MRYKEIHPALPLARHIECFWTLSDEGKPGSAGPERILPDGCVEMILNFAEPFRQHESGVAHHQPKQFVVGQMERHLVIEPTGGVDLLGVRFRPAGAFPFLRFPMSELTGRIEPLSAVVGPIAREVCGRLADARPADRIRVLEGILLRRLGDARHDQVDVEAAVSHILRSAGRTAVSALAVLGTGERQLERRFRERVGLSAKRLSRIIRFQSTFRAAERGAVASGAELAAACGYYDQAHFIREFRQFSGESPAAFLERIAPLTAAFTRKDRASDSYNTAG